jgi:hypothetical protein
MEIYFVRFLIFMLLCFFSWMEKGKNRNSPHENSAFTYAITPLTWRHKAASSALTPLAARCRKSEIPHPRFNFNPVAVRPPATTATSSPLNPIPSADPIRIPTPLLHPRPPRLLGSPVGRLAMSTSSPTSPPPSTCGGGGARCVSPTSSRRKGSPGRSAGGSRKVRPMSLLSLPPSGAADAASRSVCSVRFDLGVPRSSSVELCLAALA